MKDVVEGESTYVNIICPFDKKDEPVYWKINQKLYHTSNLPYIFKSTVYGVLTLETINRRMNHWEIQCIRVDSNKELMRGERTVLRVLYGNATYSYCTACFLFIVGEGVAMFHAIVCSLSMYRVNKLLLPVISMERYSYPAIAHVYCC